MHKKNKKNDLSQLRMRRGKKTDEAARRAGIQWCTVSIHLSMDLSMDSKSMDLTLNLDILRY